ncbi:MerR family transcriptional regulator [Thermodesulfovibrio sp.]|uniref:MerR family transcriptional regulator n=1 Tax=Thermodesulfovibrio sp. TaxID=2067987 RepID=UPI0030AE8F2A
MEGRRTIKIIEIPGLKCPGIFLLLGIKLFLYNLNEMIEKRYTIGELERLTKTNRRTIHFYVQMGLIPRPDSRGGAASYSEEALVRLNLIRELKKQRLTLNEIREFFEKRDKEILASTYDTQFKLNKFFSDETLQVASLEDSYDIFDEYPPQKRVTRESIIRIKIDNGIELYIDKEIYKQNYKYIRKGISRFIEALLEKKIGRPKKE